MISVAMCTYNGEKFIQEQLESIVNQTISPDEIIICDDGSSDNTIEIIEATLKTWEGKWSVIRNNHNLGFAKNFQKSMSLCTGDIIFLSDQDDIWDLNKISVMSKFLQKKSQYYLVFHDAELVDADLNLLYQSFWNSTYQFNCQEFLNHDYKKLLEVNVVQGSACALKKELFELASPFPDNIAHDQWLALVAASIKGLVPLKMVLMKYRQADNVIGGLPNTTQDKIKKWVLNFNLAMELHVKVLIRQSYIFNKCLLENHIVNFEFCDLFKAYGKFVNKRINLISGKKGNRLYMFTQIFKYIYFSSNLKIASKNFIKDIIVSLFYRDKIKMHIK